MFQRRERSILEFMLWAVAAVLTPYSTYIIVQYGDLASFGAPLLNSLLFVAAMLCTKINTSLNEELERHIPDDETDEGEDDLSDTLEHVGGLRVLRLARTSPLRGFGMERGIIRTINGSTPESAEEANHLLRPGNNEIEWVARSGKKMTSSLVINDSDLRAQFEQIKPPAVAEPTQVAEPSQIIGEPKSSP